MKNKYLLTYFYTNENPSSVEGFCWFKTEEEMKGYIKHYKNTLKNFMIVEALKIIEAEDIIIDIE